VQCSAEARSLRSCLPNPRPLLSPFPTSVWSFLIVLVTEPEPRTSRRGAETGTGPLGCTGTGGERTQRAPRADTERDTEQGVHSLSRSNEMTSVRSLVLLALLALVVLLATPAAAAAAHEAEAATAQLVQTARGSIERLKARIQHPTASQQELVEQVDEEALLLESQAEAEATWCNAQGRQGPTTRQRPKRKLHLHDHMLTRVSFLSCVRVVNTLEWVEDDPPEVQALAEYIRLQLVPAAQGVVNENGRRDRSVSPPRADDRSVRQRQASPVRGAQMIPAFGFVDISSSATALAYPVPPITNLKNAHGLGAGFPSVIISGFTYTFDAGAGNHNRVRRVSGPVTTGGKTNPATAATEYCDALLQPVMPAVGAPYANTDLIRNRAKWETGHMIAASLGGSNTEPINFYPQHRVSNHQGARWGDAEMLALALKTLCLGQAAGMRVTVSHCWTWCCVVRCVLESDCCRATRSEPRARVGPSDDAVMRQAVAGVVLVGLASFPVSLTSSCLRC
jgi:hypothetical protein